MRCSYAENVLHSGSEPHREDMRTTENSSYSLLVVVDSRCIRVSRWADAKKTEKELDSMLIERAHEGMMRKDFERRDVKDVGDVLDPWCLTSLNVR
jgi:hypothetical protein